MRRKRGIHIAAVSGDPGKDLFAYLFLLIMVFSFMLLMSVDQSQARQDSPDHTKSGKSSYSKVSKQNVATLRTKGDRLYLKFGNDLYDPITDMSKLELDGRITKKIDGETVQKIMYIEKQDKGDISLFHYLDTFKIFSDHQISIAFVKVVL